jgi:hypothetical protein
MVSTKTLRNYAQATSHTANKIQNIARNRLFSFGGPNQWFVCFIFGKSDGATKKK